MTESDISRRTLIAGAAVSAAGAAAALGPATSSSAATAARQVRAGKADIVILNGDVLLMTQKFKRAEALAIKDGKIQAVGSRKEIRQLVGGKTRVINAGGGTVIPGINDSHVHLGGYAIALPPFSYNMDGATVADVVTAVKAAVDEASKPDSWIRGSGWNENRMGAAPTRHDLDPVSGDHPVILTDFSYHAVAVNTKALQLAGITRDTTPPPGGVIEKDANGEPTGVLREGAAGLVRSIVPAWTPEEIAQSVNVGIEAMHAMGITSITDPGIGLDQVALYAAKARAGDLKLRLTALLMAGTSPDSLRAVLDGYEAPGVSKRLLNVAGIKIMADGIPTAAQTAWLLEPYLDGRNGSLSLAGASNAEQLANLKEMVELATRRGFQIGTHACGDATINAVVNNYMLAMDKYKKQRDLRHYVIHADLTPRSTLRKMARYDIGANMNATIKYLLGRTLDPVLGEERTDYQWPYRSALDLGVKVSSSSDAPVTGPNWLQGVMAARLREGMFGGVAGAEERISVKEALATYTRTPAWQDKAAGWKGTLTPGKVADVCVVDGNVLTTTPRDLVGLGVAYTLFNGEVVYDAAAPTGRQRVAAMTASAPAHSRDASVAALEDGLCCCQIAERNLKA